MKGLRTIIAVMLLSALLGSCNWNIINGDMLDAILFGAAREALPDLSRQHYDHSDMLRRLIIRRKADRDDLRRIRDDRVAEYEAMKIDYERTSKMLAREHEEV